MSGAGHHDHDLACGFSAAQNLQCVGGLIEQQDVADMRVQASGRVPLQQGGQALAEDPGREFQIASPIEADHGEVFDQQQVGGDLRHFAPGKADRDQATLGEGGVQGFHEGRVADGVIDDVDAAQGPERATQIGGVAVNEMVSPCRAGDLELCRAPGAGDDARAHV